LIEYSPGDFVLPSRKETNNTSLVLVYPDLQTEETPDFVRVVIFGELYNDDKKPAQRVGAYYDIEIESDRFHNLENT